MFIEDYDWEKIPRSEILGGSEMAAILGRSKWSNKIEVIRRKLFDQQIEVNRPMYWGTKLESAIADAYEEKFCIKGETKLFDPVPTGKPQVRHPDHPWLAGSPDRLIIESGSGKVLGGLEIKNIGFFSKKAWKDGVPEYYDIQAQTYMMCFGVSSWEFYVLCGGQNDFHITLQENPIYQDEIIQNGQQAYMEYKELQTEFEDMEIKVALEAYEDLLTKKAEENEETSTAIPMG